MGIDIIREVFQVAKQRLMKLALAAVTGFVMGLLLVGIAIAGLVMAVMLNITPAVHLFSGLHIVWIDMVDNQVSVTVREAVLLPALASAAVSACLAYLVRGRRKAV
ncbi:MAG TPA: hypothetical protein VGK74_04665 [Symbiobacteriaceae bacterium]